MANQQEASLPLTPATVAQAYLLPGEELIWAGQPDTEPYARRHLGCWWVALVALTLLVLLLFLFGVVGLIFFVAPFLVAAAIPAYLSSKRQEACDRVYAVTNQRLLLLSIAGYTAERSYQWPTIDKVEVVIEKNAIGSIFFTWEVRTTEENHTVTSIGFEKIPQVGQVAASFYQQLYGGPT